MAEKGLEKFYNGIEIVATEPILTVGEDGGYDVANKEKPHVLKGVLTNGESVTVNMRWLAARGQKEIADNELVTADEVLEYFTNRYEGITSKTSRNIGDDLKAELAEIEKKYKPSRKELKALEGEIEEKIEETNPDMDEDEFDALVEKTVAERKEGIILQKAKEESATPREIRLLEDFDGIVAESARDTAMVRKGTRITLAGALKENKDGEGYVFESKCIAKGVGDKEASGFYSFANNKDIPLAISPVRTANFSFTQAIANADALTPERFEVLKTIAENTMTKENTSKNGYVSKPQKYPLTFDIKKGEKIPDEIMSAVKLLWKAKDNTLEDVVDAQKTVTDYIQSDFDANIAKFNVKIPIRIDNDFHKHAIKNLENGVQIAFSQTIKAHMDNFDKENPDATGQEKKDFRSALIYGDKVAGTPGIVDEITMSAQDIVDNGDYSIRAVYSAKNDWGFMGQNINTQPVKVVFDIETTSAIIDRVNLTFGEPGKTVGTSEKAVEEHDKVADKAKDVEVKHNLKTGEVGGK